MRVASLMIISLLPFFVHSGDSMISLIALGLSDEAKSRSRRFNQPVTFLTDRESVRFYVDPKAIKDEILYFKANKHFDDVYTFDITNGIDPLTIILIFDTINALPLKSIKEELYREVASWNEDQWQK